MLGLPLQKNMFQDKNYYLSLRRKALRPKVKMAHFVDYFIIPQILNDRLQSLTYVTFHGAVL